MPSISGVLKDLKDRIAQTILSYVTTFLATVERMESVTILEFGMQTLSILARVLPPEFVKLLLDKLMVLNLQLLYLGMNLIALAKLETSSIFPQNCRYEFFLESLMALL